MGAANHRGSTNINLFFLIFIATFNVVAKQVKASSYYRRRHIDICLIWVNSLTSFENCLVYGKLLHHRTKRVC